MAFAVEDDRGRDLDIAIVGMAGRFSGSSDLSQFWRALMDGIEGISVFSEEELIASGVDPARVRRSNYVKAGGILDDCEEFDHDFFGITPKEAELMDPQHRLFLECAWQAFEDAGYVPGEFKGLVGVYAGAAFSSYFLTRILPNLDQAAAVGLFLTSLSNDRDFMPMRVSYKLNLRGPSLAVGTACSTSLVAAHLACKALLAGECDMALAGAACLHFPIKAGYVYEEGGILSPDGHCRAFDQSAQGTVSGSGVASVVLKRFEDAISDRDYIYAVIKGSAINNDGAQKVGFTAPSIDGQAEVIRTAHLMAGVSPETITYVEAHGTGTPIGDPIEIQALTEVFRAATERRGFCAIASVKTNIGHALEAAGIAGMIKVALALNHRKIPPSLHFSTPNTKLKLDQSPFYVNDRVRDWHAEHTPLRAGVSSFGIGGTNAHMVLEEAPPQLIALSQVGVCSLLTLSARTQTALDKTTAQLGARLASDPLLDIRNVAYTLHVGRKAFDYRRIVVCHKRQAAVDALSNINTATMDSNAGRLDRPLVGIWFGEDLLTLESMAELYRFHIFFKGVVENCLDLLPERSRREVSKIFLSSELAAPEACAQAQVISEFALARLWNHWGLEFQGLAGVGIGQLVVGCLAEVFTLRDALSLATVWQQRFPDLTGSDPLDGHALLLQLLQRVDLSPPKLHCISANNGGWLTAAEACDPSYWAGLQQPRSQATHIPPDAFVHEGLNVLLRIGTGALSENLKEARDNRPDYAHPCLVISVPVQHESVSITESLVSAVGQLWLRGWEPRWEAFHEGDERSRIPLPTYPFERTLCRFSSDSNVSGANNKVRKSAPLDTSLMAVSHLASPPQEALAEEESYKVRLEQEVQGRIKQIWTELLGVEQIDLNDDFFDLGGDSLLMTRLASRISEMLPVELPLNRIYGSPTIGSIASAVTGLLLSESHPTETSTSI